MSLGQGIGGLGIVGSIFGGILRANAAKKSGRIHGQLTGQQQGRNLETRDEIRADTAESRDIGKRATRTLSGTATADAPGLDITFEDERADFEIEQGLRGINQLASQKGQVFAGSAIEAGGNLIKDIRSASAQRKIDQLFALKTQGDELSIRQGQIDTDISSINSQLQANTADQQAASKLDRGDAFASIFTGARNSVIAGAAANKFIGGSFGDFGAG